MDKTIHHQSYNGLIQATQSVKGLYRVRARVRLVEGYWSLFPPLASRWSTALSPCNFTRSTASRKYSVRCRMAENAREEVTRQKCKRGNRQKRQNARGRSDTARRSPYDSLALLCNCVHIEHGCAETNAELFRSFRCSASILTIKSRLCRRSEKEKKNISRLLHNGPGSVRKIFKSLSTEYLTGPGVRSLFVRRILCYSEDGGGKSGMRYLQSEARRADK